MELSTLLPRSATYRTAYYPQRMPHFEAYSTSGDHKSFPSEFPPIPLLVSQALGMNGSSPSPLGTTGLPIRACSSQHVYPTSLSLTFLACTKRVCIGTSKTCGIR